ncbi:MAG: DoxX family protein [Thermomicrobiales bacterium]|nr:DoxX family protein [Thermomicrobiales bacterium]MCO5221742.1 DoxX family protein [Thermomicrobiales bacterium]
MTRQRTYSITALAAALYVFLCWAFADGMFALDALWDSDAIAGSNIWTYVFIALIIIAGVYQARKLPDNGIAIQPTHDEALATPGQVDDPVWWKLLLGNVYFSLIWLPLRFFVGREWLSSGEGKVRGGDFTSGESLAGYWTNAVAVPEQGRPLISYGWYRDFLQYMLDREWYTWFADLVMWGEVLIGLGILVGALVGIAAFFGTVMNFSFQLAGTTSSNPVLFGLSVFLILAWKVAGYWGLDRYLLPLLGTPWHRGAIFEGDKGAPPTTPVVGGQLRTN